MAVKWAPLYIPFARRKQTAVVWLTTFAILISQIVFFFFLLNPFKWSPSLQILRQASLLYVVWQIYDYKTPRQGGRMWLWYRHLPGWLDARDFFPAHLHVLEPLDPNQQYILGVHPHGVVSMSATVTLATESCSVTRALFPSAFQQPAADQPGSPRGQTTGENAARVKTEYDLVPRFLTITFNFVLPVWRELVMSLGFVSATRDSATHNLNLGRNLIVVPGGASESLLTGPGSADLVLLRRKGFVRLALEHGANLVPVFLFGENELYDHSLAPPDSKTRKFQMALKRLCGFTLPMARGRGLFQYTYGLLPRRVPIHTVVGHPIRVQKTPQPSQEQVDALHAQYVQALTELHDTYAERYFEEAKAALRAQGEDVSQLKLHQLRVVE